MTNIGDIFGNPGEINEAPFDPSRLDSELDRIMANRPIPGAPDGYVSPHVGPQGPTPDGGPAGAVPGAPAPIAPAAPAPPPFNWDTGVSSPWPAGQPPAYAPPAPAAPPADPGSPPVAPAAPAAPPAPAPAAPLPGAPPAAPPPLSWWDQLSPLEQQELMMAHQALRDPERQAGVRQAYIGGAQPPAAPPLAPPAAAPPAAPPAPAPLPEGLLEGSPEAQMWSMQQEHDRQLNEIRTQVTQQNQATEAETIKRAAEAAGTKFANKYGRSLAPQEMQWVAQMAGYQGLPDAFKASNPRLSHEEAMTQALEFQLRSTDSLLTKVLSAPPAMPPGVQPTPGIPAPPPQPPAAGAPLVYPGQSPEADARHRYLTALSSAASPSGDVPGRQPIQHRPDGKIDERSRFALIQEMTGGGVMGELMGPG